MLSKPPNPKQRPLPHSARITIMYQPPVPPFRHPVKQHVMHHPVAKRRRKNLSHHRIMHNKRNPAARMIAPLQNIVAKSEQILRHPHLKHLLVVRRPLRSPRLIKRASQLRHQPTFNFVTRTKKIRPLLTIFYFIHIFSFPVAAIFSTIFRSAASSASASAINPASDILFSVFHSPISEISAKLAAA